MGYTNYWTNSNKAVSDLVRLQFLEMFYTAISWRPDIKIEDIVECKNDTESFLLFNGSEEGDLCHETMEINFEGNGKGCFCKTARKPYDEIVVAMLVIAESMGIITEWSSDGDDEDYANGVDLANAVLTINDN